MQKLPISAFIICKNEESNLGHCIESLECCAEIVIVDSGSTDGTRQLVEKYISEGWPIKFIVESWRGYAAQKQFALDQCNEDWCLSLDGDERLCTDLQEQLPNLLDAPDEVVGWRFQRRPYLLGYGYTPRGVHEGWILRLIRNGRGQFDLSRTVHEGIVPEGKIRDCRKGSLLHYRPTKIDQQILKENKYSCLKADYLIAHGVGARKFKMIFNPPMYFFRLYFLNRMWRCGFPGFIHAATASVYSFLTETKLYQRNVELISPPWDDVDNRLSSRSDKAERDIQNIPTKAA